MKAMGILIPGCSYLDKARAIVPDVSLNCLSKACGQGINADHRQSNGYSRNPSARTFNRDLKDRGLEVRASTGKVNNFYGLKIGVDVKSELEKERGKVTDLLSVMKDRGI